MSLRTLPLLVVLAACNGVPLAPVDASPSVVYDDPRIDGEALSDALLAQMTRTRVPGLSACIVEAGNIVWCVAHGWADLENERPVLVETPFLLASVSKLFTATLVMQRRDEGDFALDDAIDTGMPFSAQHPSGEITFRDLLTHHGSVLDSDVMDSFYTQGADPELSLRAVTEGYFDLSGSYYTAEENFGSWAPGSEFEYSNMGYALLGYAVEHHSGTDFSEHSQRALFEPLGMRLTSWRLSDFDPEAVAVPHTARLGGFESLEHYTFADYPNGGLRSTAPDVGRFLAAILAGGTLGDTRILATSTVGEMFSRHADDGESGVGLGWFHGAHGDPGWRYHDGGENGVLTSVGVHPGLGVGFVLLLNSDRRSEGFSRMEQALIEAATAL